MSSRSKILFFALLLCLMVDAGCGTAVQPGQRGLRWYPLSGGLSSHPLSNGFYWRAPWNDIYTYDVRW